MTFDGNCTSIMGQNHKNENKCQDSSGFLRSEECAICVVADGHSYSERGEVGSKLAVEISIDILKKRLKDVQKFHQLLKDNGDRLLSKIYLMIKEQWLQSVFRYHFTNPYSDNELERHPETNSSEKLYDEYGCTLLIGAVSNNFAFTMQLGDGSAVWIDKNGEGRCLKGLLHEKCINNQTPSISWKNSERYLMKHFTTEPASIPSAIVLFSDWIPTDSSCDLALDCFSIMADQKNWYDKICPNIKKISDEGTGDDSSVAIIYECSSNFVLTYYKHFKKSYPSNTLPEHPIFGKNDSKIIYSGKYHDSDLFEKAIVQAGGASSDVSLINGRLDRTMPPKETLSTWELNDRILGSASKNYPESQKITRGIVDILKEISKNNPRLNPSETILALTKVLNILKARSNLNQDLFARESQDILDSMDFSALDELLGGTSKKLNEHLITRCNSDRWYDESLIDIENHNVNGNGSMWLMKCQGKIVSGDIVEGTIHDYRLFGTYIGKLLDGKKHDENAAEYLSGIEYYIGSFRNGLRSGKGILIRKVKNMWIRIDSTFINGEAQGLGCEYESEELVFNGDLPEIDVKYWKLRYYGEYKCSLKHGSGQSYDTNCFISGNFESGNIRQGTIVFRTDLDTKSILPKEYYSEKDKVRYYDELNKIISDGKKISHYWNRITGKFDRGKINDEDCTQEYTTSELDEMNFMSDDIIWIPYYEGKIKSTKFDGRGEIVILGKYKISGTFSNGSLSKGNIINIKDNSIIF